MYRYTVINESNTYMIKKSLVNPAGFLQLKTQYPDVYNDVVNGCGTESTWYIPDTIYGLDISEACNRHDYMYTMGNTEKDREFADIIFLRNLVTLIRNNSKLLYLPRLYRAITYYFFVDEFGYAAFRSKDKLAAKKIINSLIKEV